jgi:DNA repair exonuclease SbcCD ATPase subunit
MFDPDSDTDHLPAETAIADVTALIRLISDPKASQRRLDQIVAAEARLKEEVADTKRRDAQRSQDLDAREAAVAEKDAEAEALKQRRLELTAQAEAQVAELSEDRRMERMLALGDEYRELERRVTSKLMRIAHLDAFYNPVMQAFPSLDQVIDSILSDHPGARTEPAFEHNLETDGREQVAVEGLVAGSTLTRSIDKPRRGADRH